MGSSGQESAKQPEGRRSARRMPSSQEGPLGKSGAEQPGALLGTALTKQ